jgi:HTH-type transcriptional regulator/antitoxin HipB
MTSVYDGIVSRLGFVPEREHSDLLRARNALIFPYGNITLTFSPKRIKYSRTVTCLDRMQAMRYTPQDIGKLVRETRKGLGATQKALALTSGTGLRFIIELERGKETAEIGKVLTVLQTLGIQLTLTPPPTATKRG